MMNLIHNLYKGAINFSHNRPINSVTEIRITRLCTQRCLQCDVYNRKTEFTHIDITHFEIIAQKLMEYGSFIGMISGGEPLLNPELAKILLRAKNVFSSALSLVSGLYVENHQLIKRIADLCLDKHINIQTSLDGLGQLGDKIRGVKNFSNVVLNNMEYIAKRKEQLNSKSLLYANVVISNLNLAQIPEIFGKIKNVGWQITIGMYHNITETTSENDELILRDTEQLQETINFLIDNPDVLNLNSFVKGIINGVRGNFPKFCPFVDGKKMITRTVIMENGDVHLCFGGPIGNIYKNSIKEIFESEIYKKRLEQYKNCNGCWTSCYTQKYLLLHPQNITDFIDNIKKVFNLRFALS